MATILFHLGSPSCLVSFLSSTVGVGFPNALMVVRSPRPN